MEPSRFNTKKIFIIGVLILIVLGVIAFFILRTPRGQSPDTPRQPDTFPFQPGQTGTSTTSPTDGAPLEPEGEEPFSVSSGERLRKITDYPVTNYKPFEKTQMVSEVKLNEETGESELVSFPTNISTVRFNAKQTGTLSDADVTKDVIVISQRSTTDIPGAEEVWFGTNGNPAIFRTWNSANRTLYSLVGTLPQDTPLSYCQTMFTKNASRGTKGTEVAALQRYLEEVLRTPVSADGVFGAKTATFVTSLQKNLSLPETGVFDTTTRTAVNEDCTSRQQEFARSTNNPAELRAIFLEDNIIRGTVSPDGSQLFFLVTRGAEIVGILANIDGTGRREIFSSPFSEWMPTWVEADTIAMTTLASREADGYLYFLKPSTGTFSKVLGPLRGLTTNVSPDAGRVLYTTSTDQGFTTGLYTVATGQQQSLDLATLAEKCAWANPLVVYCGVPRSIAGAQYPDAWYQGIVSFEDNLWAIDALRGSTSLALSPQLPFDMINLQTDPAGDYLFFVNRLDDTLWSYRLEE